MYLDESVVGAGAAGVSGGLANATCFSVCTTIVITIGEFMKISSPKKKPSIAFFMNFFVPLFAFWVLFFVNIFVFVYIFRKKMK